VIFFSLPLSPFPPSLCLAPSLSLNSYTELVEDEKRINLEEGVFFPLFFHEKNFFNRVIRSEGMVYEEETFFPLPSFLFSTRFSENKQPARLAVTEWSGVGRSFFFSFLSSPFPSASAPLQGTPHGVFFLAAESR